MRNLKRALSLALACVMLLGMMITGAGAVESTGFTDSDQITNQEAAAVTSGLGIFEGYTDGSFGPDRAVTRAEMAVIICKLLNGANVDPGNFAGLSKFTDVPSWAEGYVNYCASMGIVVGVGDSKFDPNRTVSTVEATTMLLKALGYFVEEDKLDANWKTVVTGRATSLKLYGELTLAVDEPLTRDNVAELVFQTIQAQRVAYDDNRNLYVTNVNRDVVVTNGTKIWNNTLAENTFDMWIVDGVVTANSCTDDTLSETVNNAPRTNVMFHSANTIEGYVPDYPCQEYQGKKVDGGYPFEYTTDLDMIGHAVRVYYKMEQNAPVVYAIADRATKVATISYNSNNTDLANAANAAGFRRNTILNKSLDEYKLNYSWTVPVGNKVNLAPSKQPAHSLILISNSSDYTVDVVIALDQYLDTVRDVFNRNDETDYDMTTANATRLEVPHGEFAKGDYVIVTDVGNEGKVLNFEKPTLVSANISKITGISDKDATVKSIVADGTEYKGSPVWISKRTSVQLDNTTDFEAIQTIGEATLILDNDGADARCVGLAQPEGAPNYVYAAQFGVRHENVSSLNTQEKLSVLLYFPDGTSGAYLVNTSVEKVSGKTNLFYKYKNDDTVVPGDVDDLNEFEKTPYSGVKGYDTAPTTAGSSGNSRTLSIGSTGLGLYEASVRADGTVVLMAIGDEVGNSVARATKAKARLTKGLSTLVVTEANSALAGDNMVNGSSVTVTSATTDNRNFFYQTSKTVYYYVNGEYGDDLEVVPFVGHNNAVSFTHGDKGDDNIDNEFVQIFSSNKQYAESAIQTRREVAAMMVYGVEVNSSADLYWYLEGNYHITDRSGNEVASRAVGDELQVTFDVYKEKDGELYQHTVNNKGKYYTMDEAISLVSSVETGLKKLSSDGLTSVASTNDTNKKLTPANTDTLKNRTVVINAIVRHMDAYGNIFTDVEEVGGITANVKVIDATGRDRVLFSSVADIEAHWRANDKVTICYSYATTGSDAYKVNTIIVSGYEPGALEGSGGVVSDTTKLWAEYDKTTMRVKVYDEGANPATGLGGESTSEGLMNIVQKAYEAAGFTVTNPFLIGDHEYGMTISGNNLPYSMNVTNKSGNYTGMLGYYTTTPLTYTSKVLKNDALVGYYAATEKVDLTFTKGAAIFKDGVDTTQTANASTGKYEYTVQAGDVNQPINFSEGTTVNMISSSVSAYYVLDGKRYELVNGENTVPAGVTVVISSGTTGDGNLSQVEVVSDPGGANETILASSSVTEDATLEYKVEAGKTVTLRATQKAMIYLAEGVKVTGAQQGGKDLKLNTGVNYVNTTTISDATVTDGSYVTAAQTDTTVTAYALSTAKTAANVKSVIDGTHSVGTCVYVYPAVKVTINDGTIKLRVPAANTALTADGVDTITNGYYIPKGFTVELTGDTTNAGTVLKVGDTVISTTPASSTTGAKGTYVVNEDTVIDEDVAAPAMVNLTLPANVGVSWTGIDGIDDDSIAATDTTQTVQVPTGTLTFSGTGVVDTSYLKVGDSTFIKGDGTATANIAGNTVVDGNKYYLVKMASTPVVENSVQKPTGMNGLNAVIAPNTYVQGGGQVTVTFTIDGTVTGTCDTSAITIKLSTPADLTGDISASTIGVSGSTELIAANGNTLSVASDTLTLKDTPSASDIEIAYTISGNT